MILRVSMPFANKTDRAPACPPSRVRRALMTRILANGTKSGARIFVHRRSAPQKTGASYGENGFFNKKLTAFGNPALVYFGDGET
jgi:hypothetical protein